MHDQRNLDVLEFECRVLHALNDLDKKEMLIRRELGLHSQDVIEQIEATENEIISNRNERINRYTAKISELTLGQDPNLRLSTDDALEFLYQEFLGENLGFILREIEKFYDNNVQNLLDSGTVHFTRHAKKIAKYNLYSHVVDNIVNRLLSDRKVDQLKQAFSLAASGALTSVRVDDIYYTVSRKYDYFANRICCCLEIGNIIKCL